MKNVLTDMQELRASRMILAVKMRTLLLFLSTLLLLARPATAADPVGNWLRPSTGGMIAVLDRGGKLFGKVGSTKDPLKAGMGGTAIVPAASKADQNRWQSDIPNLEDGKTYAATITSYKPNSLAVEGCA
jgi:uncharacterized protein (DUF2147 family)